MSERTNYNFQTAMSPIKWLLLITMAVFLLALTVRVGVDLLFLLRPQPAEAMTIVDPTATPATTPIPIVSSPPGRSEPSDVTLPTPTPRPAQPTVPATPAPSHPPVQPSLRANETGVNVRSGPSTDYARIGYLAPGDQAIVMGHALGWWQIAYAGERGWVFAEIVTATDVADVPEVEPPTLPKPAEPTPIPEPAPAWAIDEPRWIDVDLSEQRLTAYEGQNPVKSYLVSTGLPQTPTPTGQFRIWIKFRTDDMAGADYYIEDVPWVMYFYQGYGLHGVTWHANFGHPMSHGCVNQPNDMAEWLFNFADIGTLVNIHQ